MMMSVTSTASLLVRPPSFLGCSRCISTSSPSSAADTHYTTLGIEPKASDAEVKAAYLQLSKKFHPDLNQEKGAVERFREVGEAYQVLGNDATRRAYDDSLLRRPRPGAARRTRYNGTVERDINDRYWAYRRMQRERERMKEGKGPEIKFDSKFFYEEYFTERKTPEDLKFEQDMRGKRRRNPDPFSSDPHNWRTPRYDRFEEWYLRNATRGYNPAVPLLNRLIIRFFGFYLPVLFLMISVYINLFVDVRPDFDLPVENERSEKKPER